jgi:AraC-like DNA-binding protein
MLDLAHGCTFWCMAAGHRIFVSDGPRTRLGRIVLAGHVLDTRPLMPTSLRTLDDFVVSLVVAGSGSYRHADGRVQAITAPALTVVPPRVPHTYGTPPDGRWTEWFVVGSGPLWELLQTTGLLPSPPGPVQPSPGAHPDELARILRSAPRGAVEAERQLWSIGAWLTEALPEAAGDPWARAERELCAALDRPVDLRAVARTTGLGYDRFRRQFAARFGRSPLAYRNRRRLEVAATWLRVTAMTNREIAERLGYTDQFHLSRRFVAQYGIPPSRYRRQFRDD